MNITVEMDKWYRYRTFNHILLVKKFCRKIMHFRHYEYSQLIDRSASHDQSKYGDAEYAPYVHLTWKHKMKSQGVEYVLSEDMSAQIKIAIRHHLTMNSHHPEYFSNINAMQGCDLAEMVADWCAMGNELGNSAKDWADKKIGHKWEFNGDQIKEIYSLIETTLV